MYLWDFLPLNPSATTVYLQFMLGLPSNLPSFCILHPAFVLHAFCIPRSAFYTDQLNIAFEVSASNEFWKGFLEVKSARFKTARLFGDKALETEILIKNRLFVFYSGFFTVL